MIVQVMNPEDVESDDLFCLFTLHCTEGDG